MHIPSESNQLIRFSIRLIKHMLKQSIHRQFQSRWFRILWEHIVHQNVQFKPHLLFKSSH